MVLASLSPSAPMPYIYRCYLLGYSNSVPWLCSLVSIGFHTPEPFHHLLQYLSLCPTYPCVQFRYITHASAPEEASHALRNATDYFDACVYCMIQYLHALMLLLSCAIFHWLCYCLGYFDACVYYMISTRTNATFIICNISLAMLLSTVMHVCTLPLE